MKLPPPPRAPVSAVVGGVVLFVRTPDLLWPQASVRGGLVCGRGLQESGQLARRAVPNPLPLGNCLVPSVSADLSSPLHSLTCLKTVSRGGGVGSPGTFPPRQMGRVLHEADAVRVRCVTGAVAPDFMEHALRAADIVVLSLGRVALPFTDHKAPLHPVLLIFVYMICVCILYIYIYYFSFYFFAYSFVQLVHAPPPPLPVRSYPTLSPNTHSPSATLIYPPLPD